MWWGLHALKGAASYQLFNSAQRKQERTKNYLDELREFKKDDKDLEEFIDKMKGNCTAQPRREQEDQSGVH